MRPDDFSIASTEKFSTIAPLPDGLPVLGRVSMDLIAVGCSAAPDLREGEWVELDYDLPTASEASGLSQYELLTCLGYRFERRWA